MEKGQDFTYAHNDTSIPERESRTAQLNKYTFAPLVDRLRKSAFERNIPVSSDETLGFLCTCIAAAKPKKILEIGTAVGVSGICMLQNAPDATLVTIELNEQFAREATDNFASADMCGRATVICGDAAEHIKALTDEYDFIFLDGPKVQYIKYLPDLKRLLRAGGIIFADDVLMYGWVNGESETPKKRRMLVEHIREYLAAVTRDPQLTTSVLDVGNGVALSVKKA